ncbi:hypothetical protein ACN47E_003210 [Coniothyrium glycines]
MAPSTIAGPPLQTQLPSPSLPLSELAKSITRHLCGEGTVPSILRQYTPFIVLFAGGVAFGSGMYQIIQKYKSDRKKIQLAVFHVLRVIMCTHQDWDRLVREEPHRLVRCIDKEIVLIAEKLQMTEAQGIKVSKELKRQLADLSDAVTGGDVKRPRQEDAPGPSPSKNRKAIGQFKTQLRGRPYTPRPLAVPHIKMSSDPLSSSPSVVVSPLQQKQSRVSSYEDDMQDTLQGEGGNLDVEMPDASLELETHVEEVTDNLLPLLCPDQLPSESPAQTLLESQGQSTYTVSLPSNSTRGSVNDILSSGSPDLFRPSNQTPSRAGSFGLDYDVDYTSSPDTNAASPASQLAVEEVAEDQDSPTKLRYQYQTTPLPKQTLHAKDLAQAGFSDASRNTEQKQNKPIPRSNDARAGGQIALQQLLNAPRSTSKSEHIGQAHSRNPAPITKPVSFTWMYDPPPAKKNGTVLTKVLEGQSPHISPVVGTTHPRVAESKKLHSQLAKERQFRQLSRKYGFAGIYEQLETKTEATIVHSVEHVAVVHAPANASDTPIDSPSFRRNVSPTPSPRAQSPVILELPPKGQSPSLSIPSTPDSSEFYSPSSAKSMSPLANKQANLMAKEVSLSPTSSKSASPVTRTTKRGRSRQPSKALKNPSQVPAKATRRSTRKKEFRGSYAY